MVPKTILIADDDAALTRVISMRLEKLGFSTMRSPDATHALFGAHKIQPDLLILDVNMPGGNGMAVCEMLASDPQRAKIPVIIFTGCSDEQTKRRAKEMGAQYVLKTPGSWTQLKAAVYDLLGVNADQTVAAENDNGVPLKHPTDPLHSAGHDPARAVTPKISSPSIPDSDMADDQASQTRADAASDESPPPVMKEKRPKVLCIDDDAEITKAMQLRLEHCGFVVLRAQSGAEGLRLAMEERPDAIVTDLVLPEGEGIYILRQLKSHVDTKDIPVIVLTGQGYAAIKRQVVHAGADSYLTKPVDFTELLQLLRRHIEEAQSHAHMSHT